MPRRILQFSSALLARILLPAVLLGLISAPAASAHAQRNAPPERPAPKANAKVKPANPKPVIPPAWVNRLQQMTPQQQERFFSNNEKFRELPPERQAQIRQQMQRWNGLSTDQRQTLLNRQQVWDRMTPQQQGHVRDSLLPQWQATPPARRQAILGKLRQLRGLDDTQRTAKLNDDSFLSGMNPQDRQMLRDLSNLRVGPEEPGDTLGEP
jgi:hypothetical protein